MSARADHKTRFSSENQPVKNGRPKESRDRLSRAFLYALADDFEAKGKAAIERVRKDDPSTYLRVVASLQPKELEISDPMRALTDEKLAAAIEALEALPGKLRFRATPTPKKDQPKQITVN